MSFDFSAWKGPRSVAQIKADHAAEDACARRAAEAAATTATAKAQDNTPAGTQTARKAA